MPFHKKSLYIAAPLFNRAEREYNLQIRKMVAPLMAVYLPQLDGALLPELLASGMQYEDARRVIFERDLEALRRCDALLIVLNGRTIDEGAAFELGVAWSLGKVCVGIKDDFRQLVAGGDNPMIEGALSQILKGTDELVNWAETLLK